MLYIIIKVLIGPKIFLQRFHKILLNKKPLVLLQDVVLRHRFSLSPTAHSLPTRFTIPTGCEIIIRICRKFAQKCPRRFAGKHYGLWSSSWIIKNSAAYAVSPKTAARTAVNDAADTIITNNSTTTTTIVAANSGQN